MTTIAGQTAVWSNNISDAAQQTSHVETYWPNSWTRKPFGAVWPCNKICRLDILDICPCGWENISSAAAFCRALSLVGGTCVSLYYSMLFLPLHIRIFCNGRMPAGQTNCVCVQWDNKHEEINRKDTNNFNTTTDRHTHTHITGTNWAISVACFRFLG